MSIQVRTPTVRARKNIFLDFLSPENHTIYGADRNLRTDTQFRLLCESLNTAILLCGDYCILPPFFPLKSDVVRKTIQAKMAFLATGAIRVPLRESSLASFLEKKMAEYEPVKHLYPGLYSRRGHAFVGKLAEAIIKRHATIGLQIASRWEAGPDESPAWLPVLSALTPPEIRDLRTVPQILKESGESITWSRIQHLLSSSVTRASFEVNQALQHVHAQLYLEEYNATILAGAPPKTTDFCLRPPDLSYDYQTFSRVLVSLEIWDIVRNMTDEEILALKHGRGFLDFMARFDDVCQAASTRLEVVHVFSRAFHELRQRNAGTLAGRFELIQSTLRAEFDREKVEAVEELLFQVAPLVEHPDSDRPAPGPEIPPPASGRRSPAMKKVFLVHGRDHGVRDKIRLFLLEKGLSPVVMEREIMAGRTLIEKFEESAEQCEHAIVIATPDDHLIEQESGRPIRRLRQNVVLEIGYFWGKLGRRGNFSILLKQEPGLELPTDIEGIGYLAITDDLGQTKLLLEEELRKAGVLPAR